MTSIKEKIDIIMKYLKNFSLKFLNFIVNNKKYYRYNILAILILIFVTIYGILYFIIYKNIWGDSENEKVPSWLNLYTAHTNNKYKQITILIFISIIISLFYFFVHRNETDIDYYRDKKELISDTNDNIKFNKSNYEETIKNPIFKLIISFFSTILFTLFPVLLIIIIFKLINQHQAFNIGYMGLSTLLLITTLSIIAYFFKIETPNNCYDTKMDTLQAIKCFIINLFFFIPCLLVIIVDNINRELKLTPYSIYILLFIEIIIICLFFLIPLLLKFIASFNKNDLLKGEGPFYLDTKKVIGTYQQLSKNNDNEFISKDYKRYSLYSEENNPQYNITAELNGPEKLSSTPYKYTYCITFYLYINPQPQNTSLAYNKETQLFNYGNKPVILYDGRTRTLLVKSKTQHLEANILDTIYKTKDFKYQKWLYFVINYNNNNIDVFIDGKLVGSKDNVPPYFEEDNVTIGEDNGIHGSIKDIYYFDKIKPTDNIEFLYNLTQK